MNSVKLWGIQGESGEGVSSIDRLAVKVVQETTLPEGVISNSR